MLLYVPFLLVKKYPRITECGMKNPRLMNRSSGLVTYHFLVNLPCDFDACFWRHYFILHISILLKKKKKHKHLQSRCCAVVRVSIGVTEF